MRGGIEESPAAGVVGIGRPGGEDLGREGPRRCPLARAAWAAKEIGVGGAGAERRAQGQAGARLMLGRGGQGLREVGGASLRHQERRLCTSAITRACTSSTLPLASTVTTRSGWRSAISS